MISLSDLPAVNAALNGLATVFLLAGFILILLGRKRAHMACMVTALVISAAFLACYLVYHFNHPTTKFTTTGWPKAIYFLILFTHIPLAMINLPMIIVTFFHAIKGNFEKHKRWARWTWPVWMYVSITGVLVYLMLYQWYPPEAILQRAAAAQGS
ncbi:MAG: DUF420 domain-containing protein [Verrucomicrobiota bacterium]